MCHVCVFLLECVSYSIWWLTSDHTQSTHHVSPRLPTQPLATPRAPHPDMAEPARARIGQNRPLAVLGERKRVERTNTHHLMLFLSCRTAIIVDLIRLVCIMDVSKAIMKGSRYLPFLSGGSLHKLRQLWDTQESWQRPVPENGSQTSCACVFSSCTQDEGKKARTIIVTLQSHVCHCPDPYVIWVQPIWKKYRFVLLCIHASCCHEDSRIVCLLHWSSVKAFNLLEAKIKVELIKAPSFCNLIWRSFYCLFSNDHAFTLFLIGLYFQGIGRWGIYLD